MKKKVLFFISALFISAALVGCGASAQEELEAFHNDVRDNVAEPVFGMADEIDEKLAEFETGSLSGEEVAMYFEEDLQAAIDDGRDHLAGISEPGTEEAQEYYEALTDGMNHAFDVLEKVSELMIAMVDGDFDALAALGEEIDQLERDMEDKNARIEELQEQYEEEFDMEFEDMEQL